MNFKQNDPRWGDWKWQHANRCQDFITLQSWIPESNQMLPVDEASFQEIISTYRMGITPYYFNLISEFTGNDPIFRQIVPGSEELMITPEERLDPISDENPARGSRPLKAVVHRYPNRVLLMPTSQCAVYCRFCFRKRLVGDTGHNAREEDLRQAFDYIHDHTEIEEVILTGGDPFTLGDEALQSIFHELDSIKHIRLIRIHTRLPVVNPFRLTPELAEIITSLSKPVWVSAHFNHPNEITPTSKRHIKCWTDLGIPFLNQTVLLNGINDSSQILRELFISLLEIKVKPYYLHQADLVQGTSHLRVSKEKGLEILRDLQGEIPGYAIPHFVHDRSDGSGKIPIQNQY